MNGKSAGINITQSSGDPGAGSKIQIRGATSITGDVQPLIIIDGVPMFNDSYYGQAFAGGGAVGSGGGVTQQSRLNDLNPNDIESISILKDASATAIYGSRGANGVVIDQIKEAVHTLKTNPDSRRIIVSAWNVADLPKMALMPCHAFFQFYVANGKLSCQLYQRSADVFLGVPFNIASYALLTMMMAQVCDLGLGDFVWTGGDTHLYSNHMEQVDLQLQRSPRPLPTMRINPDKKDLLDFVFEDFTLENYDPYPGIKAPVAI